MTTSPCVRSISTNKVLPDRGADRSTSRARCGVVVVVFCANAKSETVAISAMQEMYTARRRRGVSMVLWQLKEKRGISHTGTNEAARRCCSTNAAAPRGLPSMHRPEFIIAAKIRVYPDFSLSLYLGAEESWSILEVYTRQG